LRVPFPVPFQSCTPTTPFRILSLDDALSRPLMSRFAA
jgi:hypothetical protein